MIRNVLRAIGGFIVSQWRQYTAFGQFLFILALAAISVDAAISFEYGYSMTLWHGAGFALVAIAFAVLPDAASMEWSKGKKAGAAFIGLACVPLGAVAYQSHVGYGSGVRLGDMQLTAVQNARYDSAIDGVADEKKNVGMWQSRLADLEKQLADSAGWSTTVAPHGLNGEVANMEGDRIYKRSKECANVTLPDSRAFCDKLAGLRSRAAAATEAVGLREKIDATNRKLAQAREKAATTDVKPSTVVNQNEAFARLWKVYNGAKPEDAIKSDAVTAQFVNIAITGAGSLAFMLLAPLLTFAAGRNRKPEYLGFGFHGSAPATPAASTGSVQAITVPTSALATVQARRDRIASKLVGMRQSRIDGHLITAAA